MTRSATDIEAKQEAKALKHAVDVRQGGYTLAIVWPDGKVDIQSPGVPLISTRRVSA